MPRSIESYVHNGRIGVLVELEAADDFVICTEEFRQLSRDLAMHIAAMNPLGISPVELEPLVQSWPHATAVNPEALLLTQRYVRSEDLTVAQRIRMTERALSSRISVRRFLRWTNDDS